MCLKPYDGITSASNEVKTTGVAANHKKQKINKLKDGKQLM